MRRALVVAFLALSVAAWADKPRDWIEPTAIASILSAAEQDAGIPIGLAHCVAYRESRFRVNARSEVVGNYRSCGIMQLYRKYLYGDAGLIARFSSVGQGDFQWNDPAQNSEIGCRYLAYLIDRFGGSVYLGLVAYRWGPTNLAGINEWSDVPTYARKYADGILAMLDEWNEGWGGIQ